MLLIIGAIVVQVRAGVFHNIAAPATFLALATATLVLSVTT
jgi:hypothetical protein